ncbi:MAG: MaoC/PaaZ C-terminal domain-containing protein [Alphaproteobacteria bacterium]
MKTLYYDDFDVGDRFPTYGRTITEGEIAAFCSFVGYHAPLFIDEEYARQTPFGGRIAPHSLIMSVSTGMTESLFRYNMVGLIAVERGRFLIPLRAGDTIRTDVVVIDKKPSRKADRGIVKFRDQVHNQRGELIFEIDKITLIKRVASTGEQA